MFAFFIATNTMAAGQPFGPPQSGSLANAGAVLSIMAAAKVQETAFIWRFAPPGRLVGIHVAAVVPGRRFETDRFANAPCLLAK